MLATLVQWNKTPKRVPLIQMRGPLGALFVTALSMAFLFDS